jgi:predicted dehydrogenase
MYEDSNIDFVYIASPNNLHFDYAKKALEYGKNVICEKPFTTTVKESKELIRLAKDRGLFLFEAITLMYSPNYNLIKQHLFKVGNIKLVMCQYCQYSGRYDVLLEEKIPNVFNPEFAGSIVMIYSKVV